MPVCSQSSSPANSSSSYTESDGEDNSPEMPHLALRANNNNNIPSTIPRPLPRAPSSTHPPNITNDLRSHNSYAHRVYQSRSGHHHPMNSSPASSDSSAILSLSPPQALNIKKRASSILPITVHAGPVQTDPFSSVPTAFLHYQPGIDAIAGPLPPPPRPTFELSTCSVPPPRPPRHHSPHTSRPIRKDIQITKHSLQLPAAVEAAFTAKYLPSPISTRSVTSIFNSSLDHLPTIMLSSARTRDLHATVDMSDTVFSSPSPEFSSLSKRSPEISSDARSDSLSDTRSSSSCSSSVMTSPETNAARLARPVDTTTTEKLGSEPPVVTSRNSLRSKNHHEVDASPIMKTIDVPTYPLSVSTFSHSTYQSTHSEHPPVFSSSLASSIAVVKPPPRSDSLLSHRPSLDSWIDILQTTQSEPHGPTASLNPCSTSQLAPTSAVDKPNSVLPAQSSPPRTHTVLVHSSNTSDAPSPPPKSFRNSFTTGLKRFSSLPRTPSRSNRRVSGEGRASAGFHIGALMTGIGANGGVGIRFSGETWREGAPSSPALGWSSGHGERQTKWKWHKQVEKNPEAMYCHEVVSLRFPADRCAAYVSKINALYVHDCGLAHWVVEAKGRGFNAHARRGTPNPREFTVRARGTSRSSIISAMTFPMRPDASAATDLTPASPFSDAPPLTLPYPSLAGARVSPSLRPSASLVSRSGGFFASLGRKASMNTVPKRGLLGLAQPHSHRPPNPTTSSEYTSEASSLTSLRNDQNINIVRVRRNSKIVTSAAGSSPLRSGTIPLQHSPSAPSGPRALPNRLTRSQTMILPASVYQTAAAINADDVARRPSLYNLAEDVGGVADNMGLRSDVTTYAYNKNKSADREEAERERYEEEVQMEKLIALVPHADRDVLRGYLLRAGQDMLAIGQYLEDERNGMLIPALR